MKKFLILNLALISSLIFADVKSSLGVYPSLFGSVELHKKVNERVNVYSGMNLGLTLSLSNVNKVTPKTDVYVGVGINNFDFQIGVGYPKMFSVGAGGAVEFNFYNSYISSGSTSVSGTTASPPPSRTIHDTRKP